MYIYILYLFIYTHILCHYEVKVAFDLHVGMVLVLRLLTPETPGTSILGLVGYVMYA